VSIKRITVIGVGSFGGYLCKHLAELESVKELQIIDYDFVESKNIRNSVYSISQVGEYKVDALKETIQDDVFVVDFKTGYEEGETKLPKSDLVIDCRDVVCDRGKEIDVRLYISGRELIIDCRKNVKCTRGYKGAYNTSLTKSEISKAAFFASQIINSEELSNLKGLIQTIDLNLLPIVVTKAIKETIVNRGNLLYEVFNHTERIQRLDEYITPIMKMNEEEDVKVVIGSDFKKLLKDREINTDKSRTSVIPKGSLNTSSDLIEKLTNMVKERGDFMNFIVVMKEETDGRKYIELLEETGGT
jgi:hypothetical protein